MFPPPPPPGPLIIENPINHVTLDAPNDTLILNCTAVNINTEITTFVWTQDGMILRDDLSIEEAIDSTTVRSQLVIHNVSTGDAGQYLCGVNDGTLVNAVNSTAATVTIRCKLLVQVN